ncbi:MAG: glycosyltransferase [bacterium]|nr:glycosyltransferase [bacterium]
MTQNGLHSKLDKDQLMNAISENTVIATCTLYNLETSSDICRAELALRMIKSAVDKGFEVIVVDASPGEELRHEFAKNGAKVFAQSKSGMGNSRRQALKECYETKKPFIAFVDPEKVEYIPSLHRSIEPLALGVGSMIIPRRKSMETYPTSQQLSEPFINAFWKDLTSTSFDITFGVRSWKRELTSYFLNYKGEYGDKWDCMYIPILDALHDNQKIVEVTIDYDHPKDQTDIEEHDLGFYWKRLHQADNIMGALERHWQKIHHKS